MLIYNSTLYIVFQRLGFGRVRQRIAEARIQIPILKNLISVDQDLIIFGALSGKKNN